MFVVYSKYCSVSINGCFFNNNQNTFSQWRIQGGRGAMPPSVGGLKKNFCQYINIITKPTAYDGPWEY